ncbi:MAG: TetR/AcrR family transcriptional regulator [Myxococcales bacterium]|nr:TetR/AcrR family transcriptional regulator [Myxococcales bacterium]
MSSDAAHESSSPRERLKEARRALYREAIVDAAEGVFARHGYEAAKVQAIAKAAGVSLATFYAVFPKKWDAYRAVQADRLAALMQQVGRAVLDAADAFDRLRAGLEGYLRFHMAHPEFLRLQLRERVPWGTTDELRTPEQTRAWEAGLRMLIGAFEEGMRRGDFRRDDAELCARTATAMSQVRLALWEGRGMIEAADAVATEAMQQFVRAFGAPGRVEALLGRLAEGAAKGGSGPRRGSGVPPDRAGDAEGDRV